MDGHDKRAGLAILVLALALTPVGWGLYSAGQYNDDVTYVALARSLARGMAYVDLSIFNAQIPTRFPPGYPILLAPLQWLAPHGYVLGRLLSVALASLALWLSYLYSARLAGRTRPDLPWCALLLASNGLWLHLSTALMSEAAFTAASLLFLLRLETLAPLPEGPPPGRSRSFFFLGLGAALCYYLRASGLMLLPVVLVRLAQAHRWKPGVPFLVGFGLGAGPHALFSVLTGYGGEIGVRPDLAQYFLTNLDYFPSRLGAAMLGHPDLKPDYLPWLLTGLAYFGLWRLRRHSVGFWWATFSLLLLMVWPFQMIRLALPLFPFLFLGLAEALRIFPGRSRPLLLGLVWVAEIGFLFSTRAYYRPPAFPDRPALAAIARLPAGRLVLAERSWSWLYSDVPVLPDSPQRALSYEFDWLARLEENRVGLILVSADEDHRKVVESFLTRRHLYRLESRSPLTLAFRFEPPPGWSRSLRSQAVAREALRRGRSAQAERILLTALPLAPWDYSLNCALARCWIAQGKHRQATALLAALLAHDPECGEALELLSASAGPH